LLLRLVTLAFDDYSRTLLDDHATWGYNSAFYVALGAKQLSRSTSAASKHNAPADH
jgi:hypothetical protein